MGITKKDPALSSDEVAVILDSVADGVFTVDDGFRITSFNRAAEQITGVPRREAIGRPCCEVFRASICEAAVRAEGDDADGPIVVNRRCIILRQTATASPSA